MAKMAAAAENLLFALTSDLLCLIIGELPDARPAWRLLSTCHSIRIQLASQPLLSRPLLQLGSTDQDSYRWDRPPGYTDGDKWSWLVTYHQALAVMKTNACRVEVAFVGSHLAATASRVDAVVDFPCLLKHGGQSLQSLTLSGVTVDRLLRYYDEGLPLKELTLMGCSCNCSVGQHKTLGDRQNVLAALKQLQDLQALSLITTDVCSVRGLSKHPSLTSLTVGGEKWRHEDEDYVCRDYEDEDYIHSPDGMPDLAGIYKIPKLTHLDLSVGLEVGNTKGGFKVTPDYYRLIGKCTALTTLEIPVSGGDGVLLSKYLTRCPRLGKIVLHMGRGWDEEFGEEVDHDFLCDCPALKSVCSKLGRMDLDQCMGEGRYFRALARKLAKSHPGVLVSLPRHTNHIPEPWDEVPVEEFLDGEEGDDEDDIDEEDGATGPEGGGLSNSTMGLFEQLQAQFPDSVGIHVQGHDENGAFSYQIDESY